jgi:hypothetical protein
MGIISLAGHRNESYSFRLCYRVFSLARFQPDEKRAVNRRNQNQVITKKPNLLMVFHGWKALQWQAASRLDHHHLLEVM